MCDSRTRKHLMGFLILALLLCEMCFFLQSANTSSFCVQTTHHSIKHVTHAQISDGSKVVYEERISKTPDAGAESFCKSEQRTLQSFIRRLSACLSTVEYLPRTFHSTLFLQISDVTHNTSGHISLIQCVYLKDGKKR